MRTLFTLLLLVLLVFLSAIALFDIKFNFYPSKEQSLKVGLVFGETGFRSIYDYRIRDAALMAIDEINQKGGLLGKKIVPLVRDSKSDWKTTRQVVENLIVADNVDVILGCWTPGSRYTIKDLFERYDNLLIYPYQYEGIVESPNIIFLGMSANQQITPSISYCLEHFGNRFFLVGSNFVFSHIANTMINDQVAINGGKVLGELYLDIGSQDVEEIVKAIVKAKPTVIFSSIIGEANGVFFAKLREAGITADHTPTFSSGISESLFNTINIEDIVGTYATWSYFQSIDNAINHQFLKNLANFAHFTEVDAGVEAAYIGVYLWAQAVKDAGTSDIKSVQYAFRDLSIQAPEGPITMDLEGKHAWKYARIGKIKPDQQFEIIWESPTPIRPIPYQIHRSKQEWKELTDELYHQFGSNDAIDNREGS